MHLSIWILILIDCGLFAVLTLILRPLIKYLLSEPLNSLYIQMIQTYAKDKFETATKQENPDRAWAEIARKKIYELGNSKSSYSKRRSNLEYIKNTFSSVPVSKRTVSELVTVLPMQRDESFFSELACYICELANMISKRKADEHTNNSNSDIRQPIVTVVTNAIANWSSCLIIGVLLWPNLDLYRIGDVVLISFLLFIAMSIPILTIVRGIAKKLNGLLFLSLAIILWLSAFAWINHTGTGEKTLNLSDYGYHNAKINVRYPLWLTYEDIKRCDHTKVVSVLIEGSDIPAISFKPDDEINKPTLIPKNSECIRFSPNIDANTPKDKAYEFYYLPEDEKTLKHKEVTITPSFPIDSLDKNHPIDELAMTIELEDRIWSIIKSIPLWWGGGTGVVALVAYLFSGRFDRD